MYKYLLLNNPAINNIDEFTLADFTLHDYQHGAKISAPIAV